MSVSKEKQFANLIGSSLTALNVSILLRKLIPMPTCHNPSLSEEPRNQAMKIAPKVAQETLLGWLESAGRLKPYEIGEFQERKNSEELDDFLEPEISSLEDEEDEEE